MTPASPRLLCVILNFRTPQLTLRAAQSALAELRPIGGELVIVDNDSADGSFEQITRAAQQRGWNDVRVLESGHNGGFGAGNNFAIRAGLASGVRPDFVYLLNSDAFPEPGSLRALLDVMQAHPRCGLAGSYIHGEDGSAHQTAFRFPSIASELEGSARTAPISRLLARHIVPLPLPEATCKVDWVAGASLLLRQDLLDEIGHFDETFFLYFEETDLCLRARRKGWETWYVRDSAVAHIGSASTGLGRWDRVPQYWLDSRLHYFVKSHGALYAAAATAAHLCGGLIWRLRRLVQRKNRADPPHFLRDLLWHDLHAALRGPGGNRAGANRQSRNKPRGTDPASIGERQ